jgi:hypothetical protein
MEQIQIVNKNNHIILKYKITYTDVYTVSKTDIELDLN